MSLFPYGKMPQCEIEVSSRPGPTGTLGRILPCLLPASGHDGNLLALVGLSCTGPVSVSYMACPLCVPTSFSFPHCRPSPSSCLCPNFLFIEIELESHPNDIILICLPL